MCTLTFTSLFPAGSTLLLLLLRVVVLDLGVQVAYSEQEVKKILSIRCEEEDVEMDDDAIILLTKYVAYCRPFLG